MPVVNGSLMSWRTSLAQLTGCEHVKAPIIDHGGGANILRNDAGLGQGEQDAGEAHHERDDILMAGSEEGEVEEPIVMNPSAPSQV